MLKPDRIQNHIFALCSSCIEGDWGNSKGGFIYEVVTQVKKKKDLLITPQWQENMKALFMVAWRSHDILVAVVLSKQNYMKETIYILFKYSPLRINTYGGFGKNRFQINTDYLSEKLDIK